MAEGRLPGSGEELPKSKPKNRVVYGKKKWSDPGQPWRDQALVKNCRLRKLLASSMYVDRAVSAPDLSELTITDYEEESDQQLAMRTRHSKPPSPPTVTS